MLGDLIAPLGELLGPAPADRRDLWIVDGTMTATRDHTRTAPCTNYRRSTNVRVVVHRRDCRRGGGNRMAGHCGDSVVVRATNVQVVTHHQKLIGDGG
jgi:hypothetical protein